MFSVALTGNIGSGKSTAAELWAGAGVPVISADELAREAVVTGSPGLEAVRRSFGEGILGADGSLNRSYMRELIFSDDEARATLEKILHPLISELRETWLARRCAEGHKLVVSEIPLLFETDGKSNFDLIVLVHASEEVRLQRLVSSRGMGEQDCRRIMAAQMDSAKNLSTADIVIENDGSLAHTEEEALRVLTDLQKRSSVRLLRLDLHLHTKGSWDCLSDPEHVLRRARELGYGRIAITDHNCLAVALGMAEKYPSEVIPGEEVKTAEGVDIIGLYLSEEIPKGTPAEETIERIRVQGGIAYLPHPYAGGKGGGGRLADFLAPLCDIVEVFNARLHSPAMNQQAEELARVHGKLRAAGSDAHTIGEVGNAYVDLHFHDNNADALLAALGTNCSLGGTEASRLVHLASTWAKVRKRLPGHS